MNIREVITEALAEMRSSGQIPPHSNPTLMATLIFASIEGLQAQWSYDAAIDMEEHLRYLLETLGVAVGPKPGE